MLYGQLGAGPAVSWGLGRPFSWPSLGTGLAGCPCRGTWRSSASAALFHHPDPQASGAAGGGRAVADTRRQRQLGVAGPQVLLLEAG